MTTRDQEFDLDALKFDTFFYYSFTYRKLLKYPILVGPVHYDPARLPCFMTEELRFPGNGLKFTNLWSGSIDGDQANSTFWLLSCL